MRSFKMMAIAAFIGVVFSSCAMVQISDRADCWKVLPEEHEDLAELLESEEEFTGIAVKIPQLQQMKSEVGTSWPLYLFEKEDNFAEVFWLTTVVMVEEDKDGTGFVIQKLLKNSPWDGEMIAIIDSPKEELEGLLGVVASHDAKRCFALNGKELESCEFEVLQSSTKVDDYLVSGKKGGAFHSFVVEMYKEAGKNKIVKEDNFAMSRSALKKIKKGNTGKQVLGVAINSSVSGLLMGLLFSWETAGLSVILSLVPQLLAAANSGDNLNSPEYNVFMKKMEQEQKDSQVLNALYSSSQPKTVKK